MFSGVTKAGSNLAVILEPHPGATSLHTVRYMAAVGAQPWGYGWPAICLGTVPTKVQSVMRCTVHTVHKVLYRVCKSHGRFRLVHVLDWFRPYIRYFRMLADVSL